MNSKVICAAAVGALLLGLSACDTVSPVAAYSPSVSNVMAYQSTVKGANKTVKVGDFGVGAGVEKPGCRMVGSLDVSAGKPLQDYVKNALQAELFAAQVYDANAPIVITGVLDEVKVNTFGTGSWILGLKVSSNADSGGYRVEVKHDFSTSYFADAACQNATNAFAPAVQDLLGQVVANPGFAKLIGKS